jgi:S-adenosylmethionine/arginine decarboxylase-like enzyme
MKAQMYNYSSWIEETNPNVLLDKYMLLLKKSGFDVLEVIEKHFEPMGYTALFLLSESHFAIHTFPEHNQTYIELSSCVKKQFDYFVKNND